MLKLASMLRVTDRRRIKRADVQCRVKMTSAVIDVDEVGVHKQVVCTVRATDGPRYVVIRLYQDPTGEYTDQSKCWCHCSCPDYLYRWEVAVSSRGSSSVINSNGEYPKIRNPRIVPKMCKHLVSAAPIALAAKAKLPKKTISKDDLEDALRELKKSDRAQPSIRPTTRAAPAAPKRPGARR